MKLSEDQVKVLDALFNELDRSLRSDRAVEEIQIKLSRPNCRHCGAPLKPKRKYRRNGRRAR